MSSKFPQATIYFSGILPKVAEEYLKPIDYINYKVQFYCLRNPRLNFIKHSIFAKGKVIRFDLLWTDKIHPNRYGLRQLARDLINAVRYKIL